MERGTSADCASPGKPRLRVSPPAFRHRTPLLRKLKDVDMQYQYNKITNLRLAAAHLDGVVLRPAKRSAIGG